MRKKVKSQPYAFLSVLMIGIIGLTVGTGVVSLRYIETQLVEAMGKSLALAATDIAGELDLFLTERYRDITMMTQAKIFQDRNVPAMTAYFNEEQEAYQDYLWLGATDAGGRLIAATDPASVGKDRSQTSWFQIVRDGGHPYLQDAAITEESDGIMAISLAAPIMSAQGEFLGAVTVQVGLPAIEDILMRTAMVLQAQHGTAARIEYQFLRHDGLLIADSRLREAGRVNLKQLGLPSVLLADSGPPGFVEEEHLRRHVPVVTGYAKVREAGTLAWGVLIRMDRDDILAQVNTVRVRLAVAGAFVLGPLLGLLLWTVGRLKKEWVQVQEKNTSLLAAEAKYRLLLESTAEGIWGMDPEGRCTFMNKAATRMLGYHLDEILGKKMHELVHHTCPDGSSYPSDDCPILHALQTGSAVCITDEILLRRDGTSFPADMSSHPMVEAGARKGTVVVFSDITERKQMENQFRQAQKMEAVGRLTGGVAHDFNNLLMVINGYSDLLLQSLTADDPLLGNIKEIKQAGERAANLTRQLLAFSRRQVLQPRVLDLNAVVSNVEKMLRRLIGEDLRLVTLLSPELEHVKADPGQVEQAIMNLAVNARDAMPQGGTLAVETANVELHKSYSYAHEHYTVQPGRYVMLAMSDTGCGMDAETRKHIFEPFFTTKERDKGTGLGLSTVYGIVKQSGGYIFVHSEPGRGTTFKIYLPRVEEAVDPKLSSTSPAGSTQGSETILLVEDNAEVRKLIYSILRGNGYTVLVAGDSGTALQIGAQHQGPIHLLISDVVMPGMGGRELADRLIALHLGMKVLFISGYIDDAVLRRGINEQEIPFLRKPIAVDALLRKVREVLDAGGHEDQFADSSKGILDSCDSRAR